MKLKCKIYPKYLNEILSGKKAVEHREIEGIELDDGNRKITFEVKAILPCGLTKDELKALFPDIKWKGNLEVVSIYLGKKVD